jgi:hypothetical protein
MVCIKDRDVYLRGMGENNADINLYDYVRQNDKDYAEFDNEALADVMYDEPDSPLRLLYWLAVGFAEVRQRLQAYEDTGLEPERRAELTAATNDTAMCEKRECEHNFVFQESTYWEEWHDNDSVRYTKADIFYCSKCLERRERTTEEVRCFDEGKPYWYGAK